MFRRVLAALKTGLAVTGITLVMLEVALAGAAHLGWINITLPTYSVADAQPFWQDIDPAFGVWHPANATYRHKKRSHDVTYTTNSVGMRDHEVGLHSQEPRVVVLGDSFVEGYLIEYGERFTELLEKQTGLEHLNFGTAGNFGTTQSMLLYKTLASRFDHAAVMFAILPNNDFSDDCPAPARLASDARYKPFLIGSYPDYEIQYREGGFSPDRRLGRWLNRIPKTFSYTACALEYVHDRRATQENEPDPEEPASPDALVASHYHDYTSEEFDRLRYAVEQIHALAGDRPMLIFTIPRHEDYLRAEQDAGSEPPLRRQLRELAASLGIDYVDLLEQMHPADWRRYFFEDDGHWSRAGHEAAAAVLAKWSFYGRQ